MLKIHHSNRLESLVNRLAENLRLSPVLTFEPDIILVQSNGMKRWLSMALAQRLSIAANLQFPYPATFIWKMYQAVLPQLPDVSSFTKEILVWRILTCFDTLENEPVFAPLTSYLEDADSFQRYQLACRVADLFDQYLVYRPDWISQWEQGQKENWQAALWRRLTHPNTLHRARVQQAFGQRLEHISEPPAGFPARFSCFGIASLPAAHVESFLQLANFCHIDFYLLNPCRQYWGMIMAEREIAKANQEQDAESLYLETGNRLLASWGRQGRDFHHLLAEVDASPEELFEDIPEDSLLHCLQGDILELRNRGGNHTVCPFDTYSRATSITPLAHNDRSLQVHVCHSRMREVEVLFDQLLDLFARYPSLKADDIIVMTPAIDAYAPSIQAVFSTAEVKHRIPFNIADRDFRWENPLIDAFFTLLSLSKSRFTVNQVLTLLEMPAIRQRFELTEDDLPLITDWLQQTAVRWGVDGEERQGLGLPATHEHTWKAGMERLLLGFALPGKGSKENGLFLEQILPFNAMEGQNARVMGRLRRFTRKLFALNKQLNEERDIAQWCSVLHDILNNFIAVDDTTEPERASLCTALDELAASAELARFFKPLPVNVIRAWLERCLAGIAKPMGFLAGGITFCTLVPMRSIPFKVVCLIGLNDGAYPRPQRPIDFDLMAKYPRRGDRSHRHEDRYLFLEALLSAREVFYLSYVGSSIRDNSSIPPSVLVSELLDYVRQGFLLEGNTSGNPLDVIVTRHPLQSFNRHYFVADQANQTAVFSYSEMLCAAAQAQGQQTASRLSLFGDPLPEPAGLFYTLELAQLITFFCHPSRFLLNQRLGIFLREGKELLEICEPFLLEPFADRTIREQLFTRQQTGQTPTDILPIVQAQGLLPHGELGRASFAREAAKVKPLFDAWKRVACQAEQKVEVKLNVAGFELAGRLTHISQGGLVIFHVNPLSARHYLETWIQHLVLNCIKPTGVALETQWLGLGARFKLMPVENPTEILEELLNVYWQGLRWPLKFFPRTSLAFVEAADKDDPFQKAEQTWKGSERNWGDVMDPYNQLVFRDTSPVDKEFAELAERIFKPIFAYRQDLS
jgi:exodeoxyribonuclease V gamma subunit